MGIVLSGIRAFWHPRNADDSTRQRTNNLEEHVRLDPGSLPPTTPVPIPLHEAHQGDAWPNTPFTIIENGLRAPNSSYTWPSTPFTFIGSPAASNLHADAMGQNTDSDGSPGYEATKPKYEEPPYEEENARSKGSPSGKELYPEVPLVVPRGSPDEEEANYSTTSPGVQVPHGTTNSLKRKSHEYENCFSTMSSETKDTASRKVQQDIQDKAMRGQAASNTLRDNYDVLSKQIKPQGVAPSLYAKHIIDSEMLERVRNTAFKTDRERAEDLLLELIRKVEAKPEWFPTILQIFEEALVPGIKEFRAEYHRKLSGRTGPAASSTSLPVAPALQCDAQLPESSTPPPPPKQRLESYITDLENAYYDTGGSRAVQRIADKCDPQSEAAKTMLMALLSMSPELHAVVKTVVDRGIPLAFTEDGETPLQRACKSGHSKSLLWLLRSSKERDMQVRTQDGKTLFQLACEYDHADVVNVLIEEAGKTILNLKDEEGNTPLHTVCGVRHHAKPEDTLILVRRKEMTENLVKHGARTDIPNKDGNTALHLASLVPNLDAIQILLQYATPKCINLQNNDGNTALHLASLVPSLDALQILLQYATPQCINLQNRHGDTALHIASHSGQWRIVEALVQQHANTDIVNEKWYSPLHLAAMGGHSATVEMLVNHQPRTVTAVDKHWNTPLHLACTCSRTRRVAEILVGYTSNPNQKNTDGNTPLHLACLENNPTLVKTLLKCKSCDVYVHNLERNTPLHIAASRGNKEILSELLDRNHDAAFIDAQNEDQETAMHIAARQGFLKIVKKLRSSNANKEVKNKDELTPLDIAVQFEHKDIVEYLKWRWFSLRRRRRCSSVASSETLSRTSSTMSVSSQISSQMSSQSSTSHIQSLGAVGLDTSGPS